MIALKKTLVTTAVLFMTLIMILGGTGCSNTGNGKEVNQEITIAEQYGLPYAPLQIVKEFKLIEKNLPGISVNWRQLGNTAAIREAMLAGELDAGFMAIPPFLIGWDKGMDWKIACGLSTSPVGLITHKKEIKSLQDFTENDRIALPQPGSVQHILLAMACEKTFGDPKKLDNILVTMAHPDGMNALLARREISAHFTTPPYLTRELEAEGMRQILDGREAMGEEFSFIVGVTTSDLYHHNPKAYKAFVLAISEAVSFMAENPEQTAAILAKAYGMDESEIKNYLQKKEMVYTLEVNGTMRFADFMKRNAYITQTPKTMEDILWPNG